MEEEISSLYKVIDNANFTRIDLENQIDSMNAELQDLTKAHEEVRIQTVHVPGNNKTLVLFFRRFQFWSEKHALEIMRWEWESLWKSSQHKL